jgi:ATP-dependent protease ClpP protease subunit
MAASLRDEFSRAAQQFYGSPLPLQVIRIEGEIDDYTARDIIAQIDSAASPLILVRIASPGGTVYDSMRIVDALHARPMPVAIIIEGRAMSSAALIAACGGTPGLRYASPLSTMMLHPVQGGTMGGFPDMRARVDEAGRLNSGIMELMSEMSGPADTAHVRDDEFYFSNLLNNTELYLAPSEARVHGLVDHVRVPQYTDALFDGEDIRAVAKRFALAKVTQLRRLRDPARRQEKVERYRREIVAAVQSAGPDDVLAMRRTLKPRSSKA